MKNAGAQVKVKFYKKAAYFYRLQRLKLNTEHILEWKDQRLLQDIQVLSSWKEASVKSAIPGI